MLLGCASRPDERGHLSWEPDARQASSAVSSAAEYAEERLAVNKSKLADMETKTAGMFRNGRRVIHVEFYDPATFPDWERTAGVLGGFPNYFTVTVDAESQQVVRHYASRE